MPSAGRSLLPYGIRGSSQDWPLGAHLSDVCLHMKGPMSAAETHAVDLRRFSSGFGEPGENWRCWHPSSTWKGHPTPEGSPTLMFALPVGGRPGWRCRGWRPTLPLSLSDNSQSEQGLPSPRKASSAALSQSWLLLLLAPPTKLTRGPRLGGNK